MDLSGTYNWCMTGAVVTSSDNGLVGTGFKFWNWLQPRSGF